jgi:hypothetical protein
VNSHLKTSLSVVTRPIAEPEPVSAGDGTKLSAVEFGSTLPPLRWIAEEDLIYDASSRTLHRALQGPESVSERGHCGFRAYLGRTPYLGARGEHHAAATTLERALRLAQAA